MTNTSLTPGAVVRGSLVAYATAVAALSVLLAFNSFAHMFSAPLSYLGDMLLIAAFSGFYGLFVLIPAMVAALGT